MAILHCKTEMYAAPRFFCCKLWAVVHFELVDRPQELGVQIWIALEILYSALIFLEEIRKYCLLLLTKLGFLVMLTTLWSTSSGMKLR